MLMTSVAACTDDEIMASRLLMGKVIMTMRVIKMTTMTI